MPFAKFITCLLFSALLFFSACKLDKPIYPAGSITEDIDTTQTEEVDTGIDPPTDATYTVAIGAPNTVLFKIDNGDIVTLTAAQGIVTPLGAMALTGYTSLLAEQADPEIFFQLNFSAITAGERANDLLGLFYGNLKLSDDGGGKVKVTTFKKIEGKYRIRGYFKVAATNDSDGSVHTVIGSYNIAQ